MAMPPAYEFNLSPEQAMAIALVNLNWAAVDQDLGHAIGFQSGMGLSDHIAELVHVVDLQKKVAIIDARRKRGEIMGDVATLALEMRYVSNNYRPDRNMLSHGVLTSGGLAGAGFFWSSAKLKALPVSELDAILTEAQYAAHIARRLRWAIAGKPVAGEPPPRPPARLGQG